MIKEPGQRLGADSRTFEDFGLDFFVQQQFPNIKIMFPVTKNIYFEIK